jgi:Domain of unknown function (DUF4145)
MSTDQGINTTAGRILEVPCIGCKHVTKHSVLASVDLAGEDAQYGVNFWTNHQLVQCRGCETISYRICTGNDSEVEPDEDGELRPLESVDLYPSRSEGRIGIKDSHLLPVPTQLVYDETIKAMNNAQPVLAGIGIRALVETICKDKKAKGKDLSEKINNLVVLGVLTKEGADILHKIRTLGNASAHEVKPHTPKQLGLALDVCEHLLQGVYILPVHAKETFK